MKRARRPWTLVAGVFGVAVIALAVSPFPQLPTPNLRDGRGDQEQRQRQAIEYLRTLTASVIEDGLPNLPFGVWIEQILERQPSWELNDCGEGPRSAAAPLCIAVEDISRQLVLYVAIGNTEIGIIDPPELFFGTIKLFDIDRDVRRLGDLPGLLREAEDRRERFRGYPLRDMPPPEAESVGRTVVAQLLDDTLPGEPFEDWLKKLMPSDSTIAWLQQPCGGWNTQPACVFAKVTWRDGSSALVTLDLEMVQRGLTQVPRFVSASLYQKSKDLRMFDSLSRFEEAVRSARQP